MPPLITYPNQLSPELKKQIREAYKEAVGEFDDDDIQYVLRKSRRVIDRLEQSDDWHRELAAASNVLFGIFWGLCDGSRTSCSKKTQIIIGAALFYLCNPFDIIPDHHPGRGYVDDALVLNLCVKQLESLDVEMYGQVVASFELLLVCDT